MTLGGVPGLVRCKNKPLCVVTELKPNKEDGLSGAMSLCPDCFAVFFKQHGMTDIKLESIEQYDHKNSEPRTA
jgi:hypothetical protein